MAEDRDESIWRARLRWRLAGAWQAPAFVAFTAVEAVLLNRLPISGDDGLDPVGGFLLCGFLNLAIIGLVAPIAARLYRRRRPTRLPLAVLQDRAATTAMAVLALGLFVTGLVHRGEVVQARDDYVRHLAVVRNYVLKQAPPQYHAGLGSEDVWKQGDGLYRTCVRGDDERRNLCLIVTTDGIPTVTKDDDQQSNSRIAGPDNPGRRGG